MALGMQKNPHRAELRLTLLYVEDELKKVAAIKDCGAAYKQLLFASEGLGEITAHLESLRLSEKALTAEPYAAELEALGDRFIDVASSFQKRCVRRGRKRKGKK
jgi:hypothetical protein